MIIPFERELRLRPVIRLAQVILLLTVTWTLTSIGLTIKENRRIRDIQKQFHLFYQLQNEEATLRREGISRETLEISKQNSSKGVFPNALRVAEWLEQLRYTAISRGIAFRYAFVQYPLEYSFDEIEIQFAISSDSLGYANQLMFIQTVLSNNEYATALERIEMKKSELQGVKESTILVKAWIMR